MKIFLSYASQDRALIEPIRLAIAAQGHDVFFDREDLPPGEAYDDQIREAIERCDLFIAFLSPDTLDRGSYTITEIEIAQRAWPHPRGRVLPVVLRPVDLAQVPAYLKSVTLLEPTGNIAATVADTVHRLAHARRRILFRRAGVLAVVAITCGAVAYFAFVRDTRNTSADNAPMALVPAGELQMGDGEWSPLRDVYVSAFYIDRYEVTVARYAKFLAATGNLGPPEGWDTIDVKRDADLPIVGVSWRDADAYCRQAHKRLPTEAEWEKAARGTDGRRFPWGNDEPTAQHANFANDAAAPYPDGLRAVGHFPAGKSASGTLDQAGNAAEWVADWYAESFDRDDSRDPRGPDSGADKVMRGGGWHEPAARMSATLRFYATPETRLDDLGFRCARDGE